MIEAIKKICILKFKSFKTKRLNQIREGEDTGNYFVRTNAKLLVKTVSHKGIFVWGLLEQIEDEYSELLSNYGTQGCSGSGGTR